MAGIIHLIANFLTLTLIHILVSFSAWVSGLGEWKVVRQAGCYNRLQVKDPLVGPLAAIAAGILVARYVPFHASELFAAIALFLLLGILALWRRSRVIAGACCCLGFFF